jgi:hypothetical protein
MRVRLPDSDIHTVCPNWEVDMEHANPNVRLAERARAAGVMVQEQGRRELDPEWLASEAEFRAYVDVRGDAR